MALADTARLVASIELQDKLSPALANIEKKLSGLEGGLFRMGRGFGQVAGGLDRIATRAGLAAAGGLAAVVTTAVSFEDAFADVRKTVDATEPELDALSETFREMARTIPISFEELAALGGTAGALGIAVDAIDEFTRTAALLGVTTDLAAEDAATSLGVLSNVLKLTADDFDNFGATLVQLGNTGASTESAILAIAEQAGAGAALVGVAADEVLGWSSAIANLGIEAEAGGTSLQKFFVESLKLIQDDDTLEVLAETAGTTADAFKQAFEEDASGALESFIVGLAELEDAERLAVLEALGFNDIRITRALLGLAGDTDNLTDSLNTANSAWEENTALNEEAAKRFETTAAKLKIVKNNIRDAANTIGSELLPIIGDLTSEFVEFLNKTTTQEDIAQFAKDLAGGIRDLVAELRGTDFSGIIDGIKLAAEVSKGAFDAFRALPAPIQQLAVAALVANKVTGGAVGQIAGGLANIAGAFFGLRGSSPAHPMWVQSVGGGVGGAGGGSVGGALAGIGRFVLGAGSAVAIGAAIGAAFASPQFEATVAPAREFERVSFDNRTTTNIEISRRNLDAVNSGLEQLTGINQETGEKTGNMVGQLGNVFDKLAALVTGQTSTEAILLEQQAILEREAGLADTLLDKVESGTSKVTGEIVKDTRISMQNALAQARDAAQGRQLIDNLKAESIRGFQNSATQTMRVRDAIQAKKLSTNVSVAVTSNVAITDITRRLVSQRISIGGTGGITIE